MELIIVGLIVLFLVYEIFLKDAFGLRNIFVDHFKSFERKAYSFIITVFLPLLLLILFRETHVYTARNLDNLLIVLSIFVSILFGIMGDLSGQKSSNTEIESMRQSTLSNSIYIATQCLISMILTFGLMTAYDVDSELDMIFKVVNLVNFYLVFSILINTLMILKRFAKVIRDVE